MGIRTVMITGDNPLTAQAIATEAGVDDFLAEATPEDKMDLIRREQAGGRLVAMTGDGTNDAPALAQADVGVAMNTGTQAAKEAGNMVDLDSNPTKLIEVVEIGKQLLITRGALTTFSVANDVAKYFAIIPAMFSGVIPVLDRLNIMNLRPPRSAILSAVIFNALIIIALIPLSLRGVKFRAESAATMLRRNLLIYGLGGIIVPVHRHQGHRHRHHCARSVLMRRQLLPALGMVLVFTVLPASSTRWWSPASRSWRSTTRPTARWSRSTARWSARAGSASRSPTPSTSTPRPSADGYVPGAQGGGAYSYGSNYGPSNPALIGNVPGVNIPDKTNPYATPDDPFCVPVQSTDNGGNPVTDDDGNPVYEKNPDGTYVCNPDTVPQRVLAYRAENGLAADAKVPVDAVTASGAGLDPQISRGERPPAGAARRQGARHVGRRRAEARRRAHRRPRSRVPRRARGQRARAEPGARPGVTAERFAWPAASCGSTSAPRRASARPIAMLNEGRRRRERGTDVVVGFVETHGRAGHRSGDRRPRGRPAQADDLPRAPSSRRWTSTPCSRARRRSRSSTSSPTPTSPAAATRSGGRTSRSSSRRGSR